MSDAETDLKRDFERVNLLYQVSKVIHSTLDPQEALHLILREAMRLTRASSGSVVLINPTTGFLEIEAAQGLPPEARQLRLRVGEGITGWVARVGQPARVGDVRSDRRYIALRPEVRSELAVPLEVQGELRGVLNMDAETVDAFSADDQALLEELAVQAAQVIHHTWLYEQVRLQARLFETLVRVGQTINSTHGVEEALDVITREACQLLEAKMCSLMLLDDDRQWLDVKASFGAGPAYLEKPRVSVAESLVGSVVRRKKAQQVENVQVSGRYQNVGVAREESLVSLLSVPLLYAGGAIGALNVYTAQPHSFSNEEIRIASALAGLSAVAIEKARLYERLVSLEGQLRENEKLSALGLLAAEVAHEIRNPLTVMKLLYHSLDLQFSPDDPRARDAAIMGQKMDHLNKIVEQILDFARTAEPRFGPVDVNPLIEDLGLLTRHKLKTQGIELLCELAPGLPPVLADATQLEQAFLNLTLNAAEAMPDGGRLVISTRAEAPAAGQEPGRVIVQFQDSGCGMSEGRARRAFTTLLDTSKRRGTGLGLAIVQRIIEVHRGEVQLKSRKGQGTTVVLALPCGGTAS